MQLPTLGSRRHSAQSVPRGLVSQVPSARRLASDSSVEPHPLADSLQSPAVRDMRPSCVGCSVRLKAFFIIHQTRIWPVEHWGGHGQLWPQVPAMAGVERDPSAGSLTGGPSGGRRPRRPAASSGRALTPRSSSCRRAGAASAWFWRCFCVLWGAGASFWKVSCTPRGLVGVEYVRPPHSPGTLGTRHRRIQAPPPPLSRRPHRRGTTVDADGTPTTA